jgi:GNAT superfamily N-acetyltransferase
MITIRCYQESDAESVGRLIADTYGEFNLSFLPPEERGPFLGPFRYARSMERVHQDAITKVVRAQMAYVAEDDGEIVGVLRGRKERLASLFVRGDRHRRGIGRRLVQHFELDSIRQGTMVLRVAATLYAVPFYLALGYRRSTGVRTGWSFEGRGLKVQPMRKVLGEKLPQTAAEKCTPEEGI